MTSESGLTPKGALARLGELSSGVSTAVLFEPSGSPAAVSGRAEPRELRRLAGRLMESADAASVDGEPVSQVEIVTRTGAVYAVREGGWTVVAVTARPVLASLMFLDLRSVLSGMAEAA